MRTMVRGTHPTVWIVDAHFKKGNRTVLPIAGCDNPHVLKQVVRVVASEVDYITTQHDGLPSTLA